MTYEMYQNGRTQFAIDWELAERILKSYWTAYWQYDLGREVPVSESPWYNPMNWVLPRVSQIEVDWEKVRTGTEKRVAFDISQLRILARENAASVGWYLSDRMDEATRLKEAYLKWMRDIQTQNMDKIASSVDSYESGENVLKFVRDTCAEGLMIGAAVMTDGASVAAIGAMGSGSFLKGAAKYQDTGSVGAAVMEGTGSVVFAVAKIKMGKNIPFKQEMALAIVQGVYKTNTDLVGGASFGKAAVSGAVKLTGPFTDRLFKLGMFKTVFDKAAVPIQILYTDSKGEVQNVTSKLLEKSASKGLQKALEYGGKKLVDRFGSSPDSGAVTNNSGALINEATLTNQLLVAFAVVNMDLGIGHKW